MAPLACYTTGGNEKYKINDRSLSYNAATNKITAGFYFRDGASNVACHFGVLFVKNL